MPDYQIARSWLRTTLKNFGKILEVVQPSAISSALFAQIQLSLLVLAQHYVQRHPITLCPHFSLIIISNDKILNQKVVHWLLWIAMTTPLQSFANEIPIFFEEKKVQKYFKRSFENWGTVCKRGVGLLRRLFNYRPSAGLSKNNSHRNRWQNTLTSSFCFQGHGLLGCYRSFWHSSFC